MGGDLQRVAVHGEEEQRGEVLEGEGQPLQAVAAVELHRGEGREVPQGLWQVREVAWRPELQRAQRGEGAERVGQSEQAVALAQRQAGEAAELTEGLGQLLHAEDLHAHVLQGGEEAKGLGQRGKVLACPDGERSQAGEAGEGVGQMLERLQAVEAEVSEGGEAEEVVGKRVGGGHGDSQADELRGSIGAEQLRGGEGERRAVEAEVAEEGELGEGVGQARERGGLQVQAGEARVRGEERVRDARQLVEAELQRPQPREAQQRVGEAEVVGGEAQRGQASQEAELRWHRCGYHLQAEVPELAAVRAQGPEGSGSEGGGEGGGALLCARLLPLLELVLVLLVVLLVLRREV